MKKQKKKNKMTNTDLQNMTQKIKERAPRTPLKRMVNSGESKQIDILYPCLNDSIYRYISWFLTQHFKMLHCIRINIHTHACDTINVSTLKLSRRFARCI